jgi:hypothetical protein
VESIESPALKITPRKFIARDVSPNPHYVPQFKSLRHDDSFQLQFRAYNSTIKLSLTPNTELFHPEASLVVVDVDGVESASSLIHEDYRIFKGTVIEENDEAIGWARIIVRHDIKQV